MTHDHILISQIRDFRNIVDQVPVFTSPRNRLAEVITTGTGSPFCGLLGLAGLRWRYSNPLAHGRPMVDVFEDIYIYIYICVCVYVYICQWAVSGS
jgi:hypothetical protein